MTIDTDSCDVWKFPTKFSRESTKGKRKDHSKSFGVVSNSRDDTDYFATIQSAHEVPPLLMLKSRN